MQTPPAAPPARPEDVACVLRGLSPAYAPTPLLDLPDLARRLGVAQVLAKDEGRRMLGSFKSLGGTYAGLRALARRAGRDVTDLVAHRPAGQPTLICASDGNHGLAVAAAARLAGAPARIYLHAGVPTSRAARILGEGAQVVTVAGTYDDAVDEAARAAGRGEGLLVPDTADRDDPVVADVMAGYGVIAAEVRAAVGARRLARPTHLFVQAGVGGLAAAMAAGLAGWMAAPAAIAAVEPAKAACLTAALAAGRPVRIPGALDTTAEMLSCGEASAPALAILRHHGVEALALPEAALAAAPGTLAEHGGPATTPSGAAGLAGALAAAGAGRLGPDSRVLILVTETLLGAA